LLWSLRRAWSERFEATFCENHAERNCVWQRDALASDAIAADLKSTDIAGRWQGESYAQEQGGPLRSTSSPAGPAGAASAWRQRHVRRHALKVAAGALESDYMTFTDR